MTGGFRWTRMSARSRAVLAAGLGLVSAPAFAQVEGGLEEIVVTAQKRVESLQIVPIAVTAMSGESLQKMQAFDVADLATRAPNLLFQQSTTVNQELSIRGIGTVGEFGSSVDPSVATFTDEIYIGRMGVATTDFFDIERIEVLRGPQGTLFGKNVVGGAISVHTAKPEHDPSARLRVGYGNYQSSLVSGHVTGSLLAACRLAIRTTAIIDGDLSAPLISVEDGAQLCGKVDVEGTKAAAAMRLAS